VGGPFNARSPQATFSRNELAGMQPRNQTAIARTLRKRDAWAEKLMWRWLRDRRFSTYKFRRQHVFVPFVLDFFCVEARLDIELDGGRHGYPLPQQEDRARDAQLEKQGIKVLRFWNGQLRRERQFVRDRIWSTLQQRAPHPLPECCRPGLCRSTQLSKASAPVMDSSLGREEEGLPS
jgi:very-short-patch-repair endonuclease